LIFSSIICCIFAADLNVTLKNSDMNTAVLKRNKTMQNAKSLNRFTIQVPEGQTSFFIELMQNLRIKVEPEVLDNDAEWEEDAEEAIIAQVKEDIAELKLVLQGKAKARPAHKVIAELNEL
jgi:Na+-transporting NADH:ubiquinone oxidoreductase subunit NqrC